MPVIACQCPNTLRLEAVKSNCHKHQTQPPKFQVHPRIEGYQESMTKLPQSSVEKACSFKSTCAKHLNRSQQYLLYISCCWQAFIYSWVQLVFVAFSFGISGPNGTSELAKQLRPGVVPPKSSKRKCRRESSLLCLGIRRNRRLEGLSRKSTRDRWRLTHSHTTVELALMPERRYSSAVFHGHASLCRSGTKFLQHWECKPILVKREETQNGQMNIV